MPSERGGRQIRNGGREWRNPYLEHKMSKRADVGGGARMHDGRNEKRDKNRRSDVSPVAIQRGRTLRDSRQCLA